MAKLFFRYGTMNSGKSLDLLKVCYNYEENNSVPHLITSAIDDRYGKNIIKSRTGLERKAYSIHKEDNILNYVKSLDTIPDVLLVDEVQFLTTEHIYQLSDIVDELNIPVICYGLRSDFMKKPFEASSVLMGIADTLEEIKTICSECKTKKSIINAKFVDDKLIIEGEQIEVGGNDKYRPLCRKCFNKLNS